MTIHGAPAPAPILFSPRNRSAGADDYMPSIVTAARGPRHGRTGLGGSSSNRTLRRKPKASPGARRTSGRRRASTYLPVARRFVRFVRFVCHLHLDGYLGIEKTGVPQAVCRKREETAPRRGGSVVRQVENLRSTGATPVLFRVSIKFRDPPSVPLQSHCNPEDRPGPVASGRGRESEYCFQYETGWAFTYFRPEYRVNWAVFAGKSYLILQLR
jgi:hypothetical protein